MSPSCTVPGCSASDQEYLVEFPRSRLLADRWEAAIELGTGQKLVPRQEDGSAGEGTPAPRRLCLAHFAGDDNTSMISYQEPCSFRNSSGETVQVSSCRLCLKFGLRPQMFPKSGKLEHVTLSNTIRAVMKVSLAPDDFLSNICERCLVKVDVLKSWARETLQQEMDFRELMNLARKETQLEPDIKVETLMVEAKVEVLEEDLPEVAEPSQDSEKESEAEVPDDRASSSSSSSSSSDEDDKPLARLRRKRGRPPGKTTVLKKRGRKPKPRTEEFEKVKKKRGRKPGSPKPVRQDYLRNILDKKCYICNLIVENNDELVAHLTEVHAGKIDYRCNECNKSFGKVTIYNRHLSCHDITVRPRKCQYCTLCFSAKESLKIHENKVHGADHVLPKKYKRKNKVYQCESCGKIFLTDSLLKQHDMYLHKKMPAATCKICGKSFATKANLEKHYIVHTKERPYKCDKCSATYVIKAVVYEIGILVDEPDNDTLEVGDEPITEQQVDLTFFTHNANKTHINLGDIPLPVATSVHGQVLTGIAPVHIGAVSNLQDVLATLPITGTIVNITQTNSSYIELSKQNISDLHDSASIVSVADLAKLPIESNNQPLIPTSLDETIAGLAASSGSSTSD